MIESLIVTLFPFILYLVIFLVWIKLKEKKINIIGKAPINKYVFTINKIFLFCFWIIVILHSWGLNISIFNVPKLLIYCSLILWAVGFILMTIGRFWLGTSIRMGLPEEEVSLKINGLYKFSRNPLYLGMHISIIAGILYTLNPIILLIGISIIITHHKIVLAEEKFLSFTFGKEYFDYCNKVRRYI